MSMLHMFLAAGSSEPVGQVVISAPSTSDYAESWVVPDGVTKIHVVVVGGAGNVVSSIKRAAATLIDCNSAIGANFGGGAGGYGYSYWVGYGGGAGGYSGNGGNYNQVGAGGGGGGGNSTGGSQRGGGVGLCGQGASGSIGGDGSPPGPFFGGGVGGISNANGGNLCYTVTPIAVTAGETLTITAAKRGTAADSVTGGAVRIMWGGGRSYPYNAGDM